MSAGSEVRRWAEPHVRNGFHDPSVYAHLSQRLTLGPSLVRYETQTTASETEASGNLRDLCPISGNGKQNLSENPNPTMIAAQQRGRENVPYLHGSKSHRVIMH